MSLWLLSPNFRNQVQCQSRGGHSVSKCVRSDSVTISGTRQRARPWNCRRRPRSQGLARAALAFRWGRCRHTHTSNGAVCGGQRRWVQQSEDGQGPCHTSRSKGRCERRAHEDGSRAGARGGHAGAGSGGRGLGGRGTAAGGRRQGAGQRGASAVQHPAWATPSGARLGGVGGGPCTPAVAPAPTRFGPTPHGS